MSEINDVLELVKKNLKNLIRSRVGSLIVILGPLLVILLAGLAFDNSNHYAVKVGVYRPDNMSVTARFTHQLKSQFKVNEFPTEEECVDSLRQSDFNACLVFSPNFTIGVPLKNQITFYVDYSKLNLVWAVKKSMTEQIDEVSLQESENLTKILLDTIEFTQEEIEKERELIIKLSTENELLSRNLQDVMTEFGDLDLGFDVSAFPVNDITKSRTQFKQWMESTLELSDKGLSKAKSFVDAADELVKNSGISSETKDKLLQQFQATVEGISKLQGDLSQTRNLTAASFSNFDEHMNKLAESIGNAKTSLDEADTTRKSSIRILESAKTLLDKSLITVLEVQSSLNTVERRIKSIEITDANAIAQPIVTSIKPIVQEKTYLNYLFPVLIALVIMFTALLVTPTLILLEKKNPASFRTFMTPVKDTSYVLANFITSFIILFIQIIVILAAVSAFFSKEAITSVPIALIVLSLVSAIFILIGMVIGYAFNNEETATLGAVSTGAVLLFISDVIVPLESMPEFFAHIARFNPYVIGSSLLRKVLVFNSLLIPIIDDILVLAGYVIALAFIARGAFLLTRKGALQELIKSYSPLKKIHIRKKQ